MNTYTDNLEIFLEKYKKFTHIFILVPGTSQHAIKIDYRDFKHISMDLDCHQVTYRTTTAKGDFYESVLITEINQSTKTK